MHKKFDAWVLVLVVLLIHQGCKKRATSQLPPGDSSLVEVSEDAGMPSDTQGKIELEEKSESTTITTDSIGDVVKDQVKPPAVEEPTLISDNPKVKRPVKKKKYYAKMTFDSVTHHLPSVVEGDHFQHKFHFKNIGDIPLSITSADASCGCTMPSFPFIDIAPGEVGMIGVDYFSVNKEGPQVAEITLKANTYPSKTVLKMIFDVMPKDAEESEKKDSLSN